MAAMAASVAVMSSALPVASDEGRSRRRGLRNLLFLGCGLAAHQEHGGSQEGHETQATQCQNAKHALLRNLLIEKHPPLLNSGWGKRTPLL